MAILARHWNILPALGLPMPPSVDRLPACLTTHSVAPIEEGEAAEGEDGDLEEDYSEEESSNSDSDDEEEEAAEEEESGSGDGDDVEEAAAGGSRGAKRGRA